MWIAVVIWYWNGILAVRYTGCAGKTNSLKRVECFAEIITSYILLNCHSTYLVSTTYASVIAFTTLFVSYYTFTISISINTQPSARSATPSKVNIFVEFIIYFPYRNIRRKICTYLVYSINKFAFCQTSWFA